jgi:hypothetical protein
MDIIANISAVVGCISACIALLITCVKPLRKYVVNKISQRKKINKIDAINQKLDILLENDENFKKELEKVKKNVLDNEADRLRSELFDCGNRCRRGIRLHPEEMEHIRVVFTKYSQQLKQNGTGAAEMEFITDYYNRQKFPEYHQRNDD